MTCFLVNPGNFAAVVPGLGPARAGLRSTWSGAEKYNNWVLKGDQWLLLYIFVYQLGSWNLMNRIGISNSNLEYESIYIYGYFLIYLFIKILMVICKFINWWNNDQNNGSIYLPSGYCCLSILVGGLEHEFYFPNAIEMMIQSVFHIFQGGWNHQPVIDKQ